MTLIEERPPEHPAPTEPVLMEIVPGPRPHGLVKYITSTDHKQIGLNYLVTSFIGFLFAGLMAEGIRTQLIVPNNHFVTENVYNQLFTMHGTIMLFVFLGPFAFAGLGNYFVPLMIGAPDMAFPRFNNLSYWLYLGGFLLMSAGFLTNNGAANFGWFGYAPLTEAIHSPGPGADLWIVGVGLTGFSGIFTAVNIITTIFTLRAPGMVMFRMPIFVWNQMVTMFLHPPGLPGPHLGLRPAVDRPSPRRPVLQLRQRGASPSCGRTSSGSSAIPRSTSSPSPTSAS